MEDRRYGSIAGHVFFLPLLLPFLFSVSFLDLPLSAAAAAAAATQLPPVHKTQQYIMSDVWSILKSESIDPGWNTTSPIPCDGWRGISCENRSGSSSVRVVTGIVLSNLGISNPSIFSRICDLDTLKTLDLSRNLFANLSEFSASSSSSCPMKEGLQSLNLSSNHLRNSLGDLDGFSHLKVLDLSFNSFHSGNLSSELTRFPRLTSLNLSSNEFAGPVPISMPYSLEDLVLSANNFSGGIPDGLFEYRNLTTLDLSQNQLSGAVPDNFTKLLKLQTLILSGNYLSGNISKSLTEVTTLSRFAANQNYLTGSIPSGITRYMRMLDLSYNSLSGTIPSDLLSSSTLETVDLTMNGLVGVIPSNIASGIYRIRLGNNLLSGSIPESIGSASSLAYLELNDNHLSGLIPSQILECKALALLNLASNKLQGSVPVGISTLTKLVVLKLENNSLSGTIPIELSFLSKLSILNLSRNSLTGEIPQSIVQLKNLSNLNLEGNRISGIIPTSIDSLTSLIELNLGNNALSGTIPKMPIRLSTALNLSHNNLSGSFPPNIDFLEQLEILDLSYNSLSGPVPSSLANLQSLTQLMLAYNQFTGPVPAFSRHVLINTTGNLGIHSNDISNGGRKKKHTVLIIIIAFVGALVGLCSIAAIILLSLSKRIYRVEDVGQATEQDLPEISSAHFITKNSIHTSSIEFMKAIEAVSKHSNIFLKTRFCTYYKAVMPNGSTYSVKKLNWSDKIFQIGSQEKFGYELELLGRLSNSNIMVPLAYVLTVDSAYLLYEHVYKGTVFDFLHGCKSNVLDWPSRYSIALGVAQGLTFLHGCTQPVLLLDMSTRTIHLKSMNEPQIGDIELYRIIDPSKSTGSLSTIAGTVGYIPPEYAYTMRLTMAGNVYSFGVILLELLTGKPSVNDGVELAKWALSLSANPDQRRQILDARLSSASVAVHSQMSSVLNIALSCVALSPDARPKMRNVLRLLFNAK